MLRAAGATVTGVDIDVTTADIADLTPQVTVARIGLDGPAGTRQVTAGLGLGLAMAAATGAPVRVPDAVMDRLAMPVAGDDLLTPFLDRVPPAARRPRATGCPDGRCPPFPASVPATSHATSTSPTVWTAGISTAVSTARRARRAAADYVAAADGQSAVLSSAAERPAGSAALLQAVFADDYRGRSVIFSGEIRTAPLTGQAGLRLEIFPQWWRTGHPREDHGVTIAGSPPVDHYEVTAPIREDADLIRFGIGLTGPGQAELRNPELRTAGPGQRRADPG